MEKAQEKERHEPNSHMPSHVYHSGSKYENATGKKETSRSVAFKATKQKKGR